MQSVGSRLREAREKRGVTLDEIGAQTRINARNLNAIEHDLVTDISSPFFYRSFVRQYAEQVGLDFQVLSPGVELLAGNMRQPDLPGQGEHQPLRVAPIQPRLKRDLSWLIPTAILLGIVVLGSGGYAAWKFYKPLPLRQHSIFSDLLGSIQPSKSPSKPLPNDLNPDTSDARLPHHPETTSKASTPSAINGDSKAIADGIHLEFSATERTWLSLSSDGKPAYSGILEPAETKVIDSQESAKLRTGNAGGVSIIFNGKSIGSIGPRGTSRTVLFTKTGYEVEAPENVNPTPADHIGG